MLEKIKKYIKEKKKEYKKKYKKASIKDIAIAVAITLFIADAFIYSVRTIASGSDSKQNQMRELEKDAIEMDYFKTSLKKELNKAQKVYLIDQEKDVKIVLQEANETKIIKNIPHFSVYMSLEKQLNDKNIDFQWIKSGDDEIKPVLISFVSENIFLILVVGYLLFALNQMGAFGNRDKFEVYRPKDVKGTLKDIIGYEDIKEEIIHFEQMFKNRKKYKDYGIGDTYNLMFSGPAGTGKTKIATLLAKELNLPIIVASGNLETGYVGGGAKVIKSLYSEATKLAKVAENKTCIIFIDEGQNLLKKRGQYKEKWADDTSNELLAHLDGIKTQDETQIITIVASNFDESNMELDEAMSRRFKKKIHFRHPNYDERVDLIKHFLKKVSKKEKNINVENFAKVLTGITPAIIETIIQEAGLQAINKKEKVNEANLMRAFETIIVGKSDRKTTSGKDKDRKVISTHEIGHFIVNFENELVTSGGDIEATKEAMKVIKISSESISRANALGYVLSENSDSHLTSLREYENQIKVLYGGVAAEEVIYGEDNITSGSSNDIEKATAILKHMVQDCSMYSNVKLNLKALSKGSEDDSVEQIMKKSEELYGEAIEIVKKNEKLIVHLSEILLDRWVLSKDEIFEEIVKYQGTGTSEEVGAAEVLEKIKKK